jgi:hypothetical protein
MPLVSPNLDDRTFEDLFKAAIERAKQRGGNWTDLSFGDPGVVLLDLFAFVTDQLLYRVNRIPEKAYVEFLNLIGARLYPPAAATVDLTFSLQQPPAARLVIPRGTRAAAERAGDAASTPVVFTTVDDASIEPGQTSVDARAHHVEAYVDEPLGTGTGGGSQSFTVAHPPIVQSTGDAADLLVAVEMQAADERDRVNARVIDGVAYRVWDEVQSFADADPQQNVYVVDRSSGTISFAPSLRGTDPSGALATSPAVLAQVPAAGMRIRASYATGGGSRGNVAAGMLRVLKDPIPGIAVTNRSAATGGREGETLANALQRGPREFQSLQRAVTARDFEMIAQTQTGAVARAKAYAKRDLWKYAEPGTVEVLLVPEYLDPNDRGMGAVSADKLVAQQNDETVERIAQVLDERRPLGIACVVNWVHYKTVKVQASIGAARGEDVNALRNRILAQLHLLINPLPTSSFPGWRFGRPLRVSDVVAIILAEPGVAYYDPIALVVDDVPNQDVTAIVADPTQPHMWLAAGGGKLYRTLNDGDGWEPVGDFGNEEVVRIEPSAELPGTIAISSRTADGASSASIVRISNDAGDTWHVAARMENLQAPDLAWIHRTSGTALLIATNKGLYELAMQPNAVPTQIAVHKDDSAFGFSAVAVASAGGVQLVAVAAQAQGGVYLSNHGGGDGSFVQWGVPGNDIRVLSVQRFGESAYLWVGFGAPGDVSGNGCSRRELTGADPAIDPSQWQSFSGGWSGGSVMGLAFAGTTVYAASHDAGVLSIDSNATNATWQTLPLSCGLPVREKAGFQVVAAIAGDGHMLLAGGPGGIYRTTDLAHYVPASKASFDDRVVLPSTWLFCSGAHEIDVHYDT